MRRFTLRAALLAAVLPLAPAGLAAPPAAAEDAAAAAGQRPGRILWDRYGIPHIYGADTLTVLRGFGYAQMENQAETILLKVATARGRMAEYLGPGAGNANVASDTQVRTYGIPGRAEAWLAEGGAEQRAYLAAFVAGLNEYAARNPGSIAPSLAQILPVVPADILAVSQYTIQFTFMPEQDCVPQQVAAWQAGQPAPGGATAAPSGCAVKGGSNGWALAPAKSASGNPILMGNPHLPWGNNQPIPGLGVYQWVEANLVIGDPGRPALNAYGVTFPGAPFIGIGFSDDVGWTHTNNTIKNADLYDLRLTGDGTHYLFDGAALPLQVRRDTIKVRQPDGSLASQAITIASSIQGPIVATRGDGHALALRVAGLDAPDITTQYWGMIRARNLGEFIAANSRLQMPFFNVIFADRQGEIMYLFGGRQPVRRGGTYADYAGILDGSTSATLWWQTLPWAALPRTIDPPGGFVANSNDPPWTSTFPRTLRPGDYPAWIAPVEMTLRPQHGALFLTSQARFTADQVLAGKESTHMELATRILPDLIAAARQSGDPVAQVAADVLSRWDGTADTASVGGTLFEAWYILYVAAPTTRPDPVFGAAYPRFRVEWTLARPLTTPQGLADPAGAVPFLVQAANQLTARYGTFALPWGATHRVDLVSHDPTYQVATPVSDDPQSGTTDVFGPIRVIDSFPYQAAGSPPIELGYGGDSYVQLVEFTPAGPKARAVLTEGNSSRPGSPHIADQLPVFDAKQLRPVLRLYGEVVQGAVRSEDY